MDEVDCLDRKNKNRSHGMPRSCLGQLKKTEKHYSEIEISRLFSDPKRLKVPKRTNAAKLMTNPGADKNLIKLPFAHSIFHFDNF